MVVEVGSIALWWLVEESEMLGLDPLPEEVGNAVWYLAGGAELLGSELRSVEVENKSLG